jgi:hypothetical protein
MEMEKLGWGFEVLAGLGVSGGVLGGVDRARVQRRAAGVVGQRN